MITKSIGYTNSDGAFFATLSEAQNAEITKLLCEADGSAAVDIKYIHMLAVDIVKNADAFIDILTMKPNSLPKARKINGGTKKRKSTPEPSLPLESK